MEIPIVSGIFKWFRKRKEISRLLRRRYNVVHEAVCMGVHFEPSTERFQCPCCGNRICGKKKNGYMVPIILVHQADYDNYTNQIKALQS
ncbi:hypothetical protein MZD04_gp286 [Pseudomonas phage Psa21]|uniref:Transposase n=1 Tax=Pseudomonas phage Psa21 TaxID=2530023 RepID=A0A481W539_9CAUD|nr:hypothetical protein MZD04_gp286 [Pseudomonas phage Psa21]QBJ02812.1 hypothetical protein PSA21_286 [Pseudomonas phage Psa21]